MTNQQINVNSAAYRLTYKPQAVTVAQRLAKLEQTAAELAAAGMSWTKGYADVQAQIASLKGAA